MFRNASSSGLDWKRSLCAILGFLFTQAFWMSADAHAQESGSAPTSSGIVSSRLPSFSIFGGDELMHVLDKEPIDYEKMEQVVRESYPDSTGTRRPLYMIPLAIFRERALFSLSTLGPAEAVRGRRLSQFIAFLAKRPDLEITGTDPGAVQEGLHRLAAWLTELCRDDTSLGQMIFTFNDGPFFGIPVELKSISREDELDSLTIPGEDLRLVVMRVEAGTEPVLAAVRRDQSIAWARRMSGSPKGQVSQLRFTPQRVFAVDDYGYRIGIHVVWTYGAESGDVYVSDDLRLRFFFLSW